MDADKLILFVKNTGYGTYYMLPFSARDLNNACKLLPVYGKEYVRKRDGSIVCRKVRYK